MYLILSYVVYFEKSKKISLSHGKDVRILSQKMRKYINDLVVVLRQSGIFKSMKRGENCYCFIFFFQDQMAVQ